MIWIIYKTWIEEDGWNHYYNTLNGYLYDLTKSQLIKGQKINYDKAEKSSFDYVINSKNAIKYGTDKRYNILKKNFIINISKALNII